MPAALSDNVGGHRLKYENLKAHFPAAEVGLHFVGGSDPVWTGYYELELIRKYKPFDGTTSVVDIGCGIGRLARHILLEDVKSYLGTDIIPEIMADAEALAADDPRFRFALVDDCSVPADDASVDVMTAFSVITHLLDEECFEYMLEARRVLKEGGVAIFSFLDVSLHREVFFKHARQHRGGHGDLLKHTTKETLLLFANEAGFKNVKFIDGTTDIPTSGVTTSLIPAPPANFRMGQSVCVMS